jgi:hypothetical protein
MKRLHHFTSATHALSDKQNRRLKSAQLDDLNDHALKHDFVDSSRASR